MNCSVVYVHYPLSEKATYYLYRFATTWEQFPPGHDCSVTIVSNKSDMKHSDTIYLKPGWRYLPRPSNEGADIGAYIELAKKEKPHLMVCFGESVYFHRPNWLARLVDAYKQFGPGMYGIMTSNLVTPHINTTAFAIDGQLLASYPEHVVTREQRYDFEHGAYPYWRRIYGLGLPVKLVTFDGVYSPPEWRAPQNIFWKGDQSNVLVHCNHTDRYANATPAIKQRWELGANTRFQ